MRWKTLELIAANDVTRLAAVLPIVGYLILFNDAFVEALSFDILIGNSYGQDEPFLMSNVLRLRLVFFGSICLLIGRGTFVCFFPAAVKNSKDDLEFSERVISSYSLSEIAALEASISVSNWVKRTPFWDEFGDQVDDRQPRRMTGGIRNKAILLSKREPFIRAMAREWWVGMDYSRSWSRVLVLVFSIAGYSMLTLPSLDVLRAVILDLIC